ncbi:cytochrome C biogenesis protein CcmE [Burkholderia ubonensis]|nr:cytochrome C biogenesis protein CcmE [Burkholderia ubonensis]
MNISRIPRRGYVKQRTPIESLPTLSRAIGGKVNVLIKRDDLLPGAGGGNKTRKLDYLMQEALDAGCDSIITWGAVQSNHCRLTLDCANREGLACHLLLEERVPGSYDPRNSTNNFLYRLLGASSTKVVPGGTDMLAAARQRAAEIREQGGKPYIVQIGASTAIGAVGYAVCALEMVSQLVDMQHAVDHVVISSGSSGSQAGLVAGLAGMNSDIRVHGICAGRSKDVQEGLVYSLANETAALLGLTREVPKEAVICYDDYIGPGYSLPTDEMVAAVTLVARTEGILLDPTYTGKAMAGLIDHVQKGTFAEGSTVLFVHTGGALSLYDKTEYFWKHLDERYP